MKQSGEAKLIAKAYNGRCITEWLAFELLSACHNPQDPRIPPIAVCTFLGCITITASALFVTCFLNFYTFFFRRSLQLRGSLARWFGLIERYPRFLMLVWNNLIRLIYSVVVSWLEVTKSQRTPEQARRVYQEGVRFCSTYLYIARLSFSRLEKIRMQLCLHQSWSQSCIDEGIKVVDLILMTLKLSKLRAEKMHFLIAPKLHDAWTICEHLLPCLVWYFAESATELRCSRTSTANFYYGVTWFSINGAW